jgi:Tfp pilus assembly protein PilE
MKAKSRQCGPLRRSDSEAGVTLTEMAVVIAAVAILVTLGIPAARALLRSFATEGSTRAMISAALSSARAIAAQQQHYAGIRFQHAYDPKGPLNAPQYMIFIVHDQPNTNLSDGFRAVEGINPLRLPASVGVMDLRIRTDPDPTNSGDEPIDGDNDIDEPNEVRDTTTFSVVFSPSGKLVIHDVRVSNRDGERDSSSTESYDDIFNKDEKVEDKEAMFYQDDYTDLGLGQETSRNCFVIYDRNTFRQVYETGQAYSQYLKDLKGSEIYINPYTGTMISR